MKGKKRTMIKMQMKKRISLSQWEMQCAPKALISHSLGSLEFRPSLILKILLSAKFN